MTTTRVLVAVLSLFACQAAAEAAPILGQVQTFDDPHGWVVGAGPGLGLPPAAVPVPVLPGGQGGAGDNFLSLVSVGGAGPGSRLTAQNFAEWAGDYIAAGVDVLEMDVRNFGTTDLFLRLLFVDFGAMGPVHAALTSAVVVPGGSNWQRISFDIAPGDLTAILGTAVGALTNADELRIFHNPAPFFAPGTNPAVVGNLGVDNITAAAAAAPEPATWLLLATAAAFGASRRRRAASLPR
jgi:hypothetical protein